MQRRIKPVVFAALVACLLILPSCGATSEKSASEFSANTRYPTIASYGIEGKNVGVVTGTVFGQMVENDYPTARVSYFSTEPDILVALKNGKVDTIISDYPVLAWIASEMSGISYIKDSYLTTDVGFVFPKNDAGLALQSDFDAFLSEMKSSKELLKLQEKWLNGRNADASVFDYSKLPATNGTLTYATQSSAPPFDFMADGFLSGYEVELIARYCQSRGLALEIMDMNFDAVLAAVTTGKCDLGGNCISITPQRAESMAFSQPIYQSPCYFVINEPAGPTGAAGTDSTRSAITSIDDLSGKRIAAVVGTTNLSTAETIAGANGSVMVLDTFADLAMALDGGKVDAYIADESIARALLAEHPNHIALGSSFENLSHAAMFPKNSDTARAFCSEFNEFLARIRADGTLAEVQTIWMDGTDESKKVVDYEGLPATNGTLHFATCTSAGVPHAYMRDGKIVGYDIDIVARFCADRGYALEMADLQFTGLLTAISMGKYDMASCGVTVTAERAESILFSDPMFQGGVLVVTMNPDYGHSTTSFLSDLVKSFHRTFVEEDRWRLFVGGIATTLLVTVASIILGTALGFGVHFLCRNRGRVTKKIVDFFVWLVSDMPTVVFLMILFYVVFGSSSISDVAVAIIGFTLIFGASFLGMLRTGVAAVDAGQMEAAQTLGYSNNRAFLKIIFPQAVRHFLPTYRAELVSLLKGTAIVGYIAVQDLTKVGDIIRSRTYEAFFPLIAVAAVYFILAALLKAAVNALSKCLDAASRDDASFLKGVDTDD